MRDFLCLLFDLFGDPGALAAQGALSRRERALMLPWLRAGEAFLRRLLFIEAVALAGEASRAAPVRKGRPRARQLVSFYPDKPEDWRVSFRVLLPKRRRVRRARAFMRGASLGLPIPLSGRPDPSAPEFRGASFNAGAAKASVAVPARTRAHLADAWPLAERLEAMLRVLNDPRARARRLASVLRRDPSAVRLLRRQPSSVVRLFGEQTFRRCDAIVASRRRRWERPRRADSS